MDEVLGLARRAVELDPLKCEAAGALGAIRTLDGRPDKAVADFKRSLEISPDAPSHGFLADIYVLQGRPQDALAEIEQERGVQFQLGDYAYCVPRAWREKEVGHRLAGVNYEITRRLTRSRSPRFMLFRNQRDDAFEWLERATRTRQRCCPDESRSSSEETCTRTRDMLRSLKSFNLPN